MEPRPRRDSHGPGHGEVLFRCRAILYAGRPPERIPTGVVFGGFIAAMTLFFWVTLLWFEGFDLQGMWCCHVSGPLICLLCGWPLVAYFLQPMRRGTLLLLPDELRFRFWLTPERLVVPLTDIARMGRRRNRIHIATRGGEDFYLACARLHCEDMYDQVLGRLAELSVDVVSHERRH